MVMIRSVMDGLIEYNVVSRNYYINIGLYRDETLNHKTLEYHSFIAVFVFIEDVCNQENV